MNGEERAQKIYTGQLASTGKPAEVESILRSLNPNNKNPKKLVSPSPCDQEVVVDSGVVNFKGKCGHGCRVTLVSGNPALATRNGDQCIVADFNPDGFKKR